MKKTLTVLLAALFVGSAAIAATSETIPPKDDRGILTLRTSANKEIAPDVADVTIFIQTKDNKSLQKAVDDNKDIANKIQAALKGMINPAKGDYLKTENYSASPDYSYSSSGKQTIKGYTVSNNIRINTRELEKVGAMIDKSFELGATSLGSLTFSVSSYTAVCNDLISLASKNAYNQASAAVKASNGVILSIRQMDISCDGNSAITPRNNFSSNMLMKSAAMEMAAPQQDKYDTVIEQGYLRVNAYVNASYYVK